MGGLESRYRIPTSRIVKPLNPVSCSKLQSRISLPLSSKIPNPVFKLAKSRIPKNLLGTLDICTVVSCLLIILHPRPQRPQSLWSAPRIETSSLQEVSIRGVGQKDCSSRDENEYIIDVSLRSQTLIRSFNLWLSMVTKRCKVTMSIDPWEFDPAKESPCSEWSANNCFISIYALKCINNIEIPTPLPPGQGGDLTSWHSKFW